MLKIVPKSFAASLAAVALIAGVNGCGRSDGINLGLVEGVVTLDGQPASHVMIQFQPNDLSGSPSFGFADADGHYHLQYTSARPGALIGNHTISITYDDDPSPDWPAHPVQIPEKYNSRSELKAEVKPGQNRQDFHLKLDKTEVNTANNETPTK